MSLKEYEGFKISGSLSDHFQLQGLLSALPYVDIYKAVDKKSGGTLRLLVSKQRYEVGNAAVRLGRQITALKSAGLIEPFTFGVDDNGYAVVGMSLFDGHHIAEVGRETREVERRVLSVLKIIDKIHKAGASLGNVSDDSFAVDRASGSVALIGPLGVLESPNKVDPDALDISESPWVAPEIKAREGEDVSVEHGLLYTRADVYSFGVLAYKLFTGHFPLNDNNTSVETISPVSEFIDIPAVWVDSVIKKCLSENPADRFSSASEVIEAISQSRRRAVQQENTPAKVEQDIVSHRGRQKDSEIMLSSSLKRETSSPVLEEPDGPTYRLPTLLAGFAFLALLVLGSGFYFFGRSADVKNTSVDILETGNQKIDQAVDKLGNLNSLSAVEKELMVLVKSSDPAAHSVMAEMAVQEVNLSKRAIVEKAILNRAKARGAVKASEQVRQWLRRVKDVPKPRGYLEVLNCLDEIVPIETKESYLRKIYADYPAETLRLVTALTFDSGDLKLHQNILSQLIGDDLQIDDATEYSSLALILAHPELTLVFSDDIVQRRQELIDEDVLWVLGKLGERGDVNTRAIANIALDKNLLPPIRRIFATMIRDRSDIPMMVLNSLIRCTTGNYSVNSLDEFGKWYDRDAERVLLAVASDAKEKEVRERAFDLTAGKNITIEPSASILDWVRSNRWDRRADLTNLVGAVMFNDLYTEEDYVRMLTEVKDELKTSGFANVLIQSREAVLIKILLEKFTDTVPLNSKLNLLNHSDPEVRIAAVNAINTNQIGALKMIKDAHRKEKDPKVKESYKKFWMISNSRGF